MVDFFLEIKSKSGSCTTFNLSIVQLASFLVIKVLWIRNVDEALVMKVGMEFLF